jgi:hypothetical protein
MSRALARLRTAFRSRFLAPHWLARRGSRRDECLSNLLPATDETRPVRRDTVHTDVTTTVNFNNNRCAVELRFSAAGELSRR